MADLLCKTNLSWNIANFIEVLEEVLSFYDYYVLCNYPVSFLEHKKGWFIREKYFEGKSEYSVAWNQRNVWWLHVPSSKLWVSGENQYICFWGGRDKSLQSAFPGFTPGRSLDAYDQKNERPSTAIKKLRPRQSDQSEQAKYKTHEYCKIYPKHKSFKSCFKNPLFFVFEEITIRLDASLAIIIGPWIENMWNCSLVLFFARLHCESSRAPAYVIWSA